jgi:spore maturation protein CgeB
LKIVLAAPTTYYGKPDLGPSYEYLHFFQSLKAAGHQVTMVNTFGQGSTQVVLQTAEHADLLMVVPNSDELDWAALQKSPCATLAILSDDQWRRQFGLSIAPHFDYLMAQAPDSATAYGKKYIPFEWAVWEGLYPATDAPRDIPVAFLGQAYGNRAEMLFRLMTAGLPCMVQGYGFPKALFSTEIHKVMQRVKIGLSFSRSSDGSCLQIKTRPFETCAAGALLISEYAPGIEHCFEPDKEAVFFTTTDELIAKVRYYLEHDDERATIAQAGHERVMRDHTYGKRWQALKNVTRRPKSNPMRPSVSVLIPAYNAEKTIRRAVRSAFNQAGVNIEVIVCNDGSTDHTAEFARQVGATVIDHLENKGVSAALNTAAQHATGEYCIMLGADDWFEPNAILPLVKLIYKGAGFAYGCTKYWGAKSNVHVPDQYNPFEFYRHFVSLYAVLFKREAFAKGLQFHTFTDGGPEDWDFVLQLIEAGYSGAVLQTQVVLHHVHRAGTLTEAATTESAISQLIERHPLLKGAA